MKLALSWIFAHIVKTDWRALDLAELVAKFNQTTAEIESYTKLDLDPERFTLIEVQAEQKFFSPELNLNLDLPARADLKVGELYLVCKSEPEPGVSKNSFTENKHANSNPGNNLASINSIYQWARLTDLGGAKEGLLAAVSCPVALRAGGWKAQICWQDIILEFDNKSLTHRPDLWGHRGMAREIAALYDLELVPLEQFLQTVPVEQSDLSRRSFLLHSSSYEEQVGEGGCAKFSSYLITQTTSPASALAPAFNLARCEQKPINLLVDLTNYVMLDLGQPMHAFDADRLIESNSNSSYNLTVRYARASEQLELLDGQTVKLDSQDLVVVSGDQPVSLAGIMGGLSSGISAQTTRVLLEAANFNPGVIRRTAVRLKLRTEASARFEKSLDPVQTEMAIERYLKLLTDLGISYHGAPEINTSAAAKAMAGQAPLIQVTHSFITQRLGVAIAPAFVVKTLTKLGFTVVTEPVNLTPDLATKTSDTPVTELCYLITVPSWRATKDISLPEDIVEEVGRFYGYGNIPAQLPAKILVPARNQRVYNLRKIKQLLATSGALREVHNYPFFDEQWLRELQWQPAPNSYVQVASPVSENWYRLVTSLIPHLVKSVYQNLNTGIDQLNFFECNKIWSLSHKLEYLAQASGADLEVLRDPAAHEFGSLAGIVVNTKIDRKTRGSTHQFYVLKALLSQLSALLKLELVWESVTTGDLVDNRESNHSDQIIAGGAQFFTSLTSVGLPVWYEPAQTVVLFHKIPLASATTVSAKTNSSYRLHPLGLVGKLASAFWSNLSATEVDGWLFELDLDYLLNYQAPTPQFVPLAKHQINYLDVTVLAGAEFTQGQLEATIKAAHSLIQTVRLIDNFAKPEWQGQRALTFRYSFVDPSQTLTKLEIEQLQQQVLASLQKLGVEIR